MKRGCSRKAILLAAVVLVLFLPGLALATSYHLDSETLLRVFERDTPDEDDATIVPGYEYLQFDAADGGVEGLSFHFYGWGRVEFDDSDFFEEDTAGELLYGYLQYAHPQSNLDLKLGRFYVFEGVSNESVEGLRLGTDLTRYFTLSAYAGYPVALDDTDGFDGDAIWGGRISHHFGTLYDLGVSYKLAYNDADQEEQKVGVDLSLNLPYGVSLFGLSAYNLESEGWGEHSWELRFSLSDFQIRPFFQQFQFEDQFATGVKTANPFPFLRSTGEELTVFGGDVTRRFDQNWEGGVKAKFFDYDQRGESSNYYAALVNWWAGEGLSSVGGELGYMQGDAAENDYLLARAYVYWEDLPQLLPRGFLTGDIVYVNYDKEIFNEDTSLFVSLGAGKRFLKDDALEIRLSGDYSSDPFFDDDLRGILTAKYLLDL